MKKKRTEKDSLGSKKIDANRFWGAQTQRSIENFQIGIEKMRIDKKWKPKFLTG